MSEGKIKSTQAGTRIGTSGGKIGFYGVTPVTQAAVIAPVAGTPSGTDAVIIAALIVAVNSLIDVVKNVGLKASA